VEPVASRLHTREATLIRNEFMQLCICSNGHPSVCYDESEACPVCAAHLKIQEADEATSAALAQIDELKGTIDELQNRLGAIP
jgi:hypothetical protein